MTRPLISGRTRAARLQIYISGAFSGRNARPFKGSAPRPGPAGREPASTLEDPDDELDPSFGQGMDGSFGAGTMAVCLRQVGTADWFVGEVIEAGHPLYLRGAPSQDTGIPSGPGDLSGTLNPLSYPRILRHREGSQIGRIRCGDLF
ncbi:unnamed protein product [Lota lota]